MNYSTGQITKILNISRPTLYKLCKEKKLLLKKTSDEGHYRFSEDDIARLMIKSKDPNDVETKFVLAVNEIWMTLKRMANDIWGYDQGEQKLIEITEMQKNRFILNCTTFCRG